MCLYLNTKCISVEAEVPDSYRKVHNNKGNMKSLWWRMKVVMTQCSTSQCVLLVLITRIKVDILFISLSCIVLEVVNCNKSLSGSQEHLRIRK